MTGGPVPAPSGAGEHVDLRLFGDLRVRVGGTAIDAMRSGRARSLLAYLVLHPDSAHSRERLAFTFWPDSSEPQARTNLRNVLHNLRHADPAPDAALEVAATTLRWRPANPVTVDVEQFEAAADAAGGADPDDPAELVARCRAAVDLYTGDLLPGEHDDWVTPHRDRLRGRCCGVLRLLATALIDGGRAGEATAVARDLVTSEPLDESGHRLRIEAHVRAGDRAGAVRAYHECVATLERELGVEPDPATAAMYRSLLESPSAVAPSPGRRSPSGGHRLVGRDAEWRSLLGAWDVAEPGRPTAVLVTGEPGVGKTRLVEELRARCADGAAVGLARSYAGEGGLGHAVVVSWLRTPDVAAGRQLLGAGQLADLARLLPELGVPAQDDGLDEATQRRRLFDAVGAALAATGRPTLLIGDDAQWSDRASLELISHLVHQHVDVPMLIVLTARNEDLDLSHPVAALRDALAVLDRLTELRLDRLPPEATGELGSQLVGCDLDRGAVDALFAESEGNPLFVVEMVRSGWDGTASSTVAGHLEAANRLDEAVTWYQRAALDAQRVFAHAAAMQVLDRALGLVPRLPADVRHTRELELLSVLPGALAGIDGYGTVRMIEAHERAVAVSSRLGVDLEPSFVRSMVMSALCRDEFEQASATATQLLAHADATGDEGLRIESHYLLGIAAFWAAGLDDARHHFELVVVDFDRSTRQRHQLVYGHDPFIVCLSRLANTLWFLGRDDEARTACDRALVAADEVGHPLSHDTAVIFACVLGIDDGDHDRLRTCAARLGALGRDSLPHDTKREALLGLIDVLDGRSEGIARARTALDRCDGRNFYPGFRATIARAMLAAHEAGGDPNGGLDTVALALTMGSTPLWEAEALRLRATFLDRTGADRDEIVAALDAAEAVARRQGAVGHLRRVVATREQLVDAPTAGPG